MEVIVLAPSERSGRQWQYAVEDLGAQWRCTPSTSAEQADFLLREWVDVLLLLPGGESDVLLRSLTLDPPLAPPFTLGMGAPDGPLPDAAELPELKNVAYHTSFYKRYYLSYVDTPSRYNT